MTSTFPPGGGIRYNDGDQLQFTIWGINGGPFRASVNYQKDGTLVPATLPLTLTPNTNRSGKSITATMSGSGTIYSVGISQVAGSVPAGPGEVFCAVNLARSTDNNVQLVGGYFYPGHVPRFPGLIEGPLDGRGRIYTATGIDPAANTEVADTVPTNAVWKLYAAEVVLVTDGNAANRNVNLYIDDAAGTITRRQILTDSTNQTATLTRTHGWYPGTDAVNTASVALTDGAITLLAKFPLSLPVQYLQPGYNIRTITTAIQVTDNYGAPRYIVEEWILPS